MMLSGKTALGQAQAAAGYSAPLLPFASFPAALSADGQILRPAEVPRVELMASGGMWLPRGGRQVLQSRHGPPIITQDTGINIAELLGPFPGGLVRAGMRLVLDFLVQYDGITGSARVAYGYLGGSRFTQINAGDSGANKWVRHKGWIVVSADTSAPHLSGPINSVAYIGNQTYETPTADFSQSWSASIRMQSVQETAVNIASATWAAGVATFNTSAPSTLVTGDKTVIAGVSPAGWNIAAGAIVTRIDDDTFTVPMAADPGAYVSGGTTRRVSNMKLHSYTFALES